ncbi:MAG: glycosyltransferase, partial [Gemmatimonadaceae bacterium]|nr:glycosyltransferase [Chitinophagaceae bacterium]
MRKVIKLIKASGHENLAIRLLILSGICFLAVFTAWYLKEQNSGYTPLYLLLCISLSYKFLKLLFEWYHYWAISTSVRPELTRTWTVDMLTTAMPGEPFEMIEETLTAMVNVRYPHTTWLCDEGNDPALKALCDRLGVRHVTRTLKTNAKAGNINNALQQATGEICVVLDPDHVPSPDFLDEVIPFFENEKVGFVQVVQAYKNSSSSWIARGAAQQTYTFYGPLMMGMNTYGTAQAIGANCTFRRAALDSIGGHAAGLAEDMHTAMQLHAAGWESVYHPKIVAEGLVPANINAYYKQQLKWSRGTFDLLFHAYPKMLRGFSLRQKMHYFLLPLHFAAGLVSLIDFLIPIIALFTMEVPLYFGKAELVWLLLPLVMIILLIRQFSQRWLMKPQERGFHIAGGILLIGTWWVYCIGFFYTIFGVRVPYIPTPKEDSLTNNWVLSIPNFTVAAVSISAVVYGLSRDWNPYNFIMAGFALLNAIMMLIVVFLSQQLAIVSVRSRFALIRPAKKLAGFFYAANGHIFSFIYGCLRNGAPVLAILIIISAGFVTWKNKNIEELSGITITNNKETGGFYTGVYLPAINNPQSLSVLDQFEKSTGTDLSVVSVYDAWSSNMSGGFPSQLLTAIAAKRKIPMITWEPWVDSSDAMSSIAAGSYDEYVKAYTQMIKAHKAAVFIRFGHEPDNFAYPWASTKLSAADNYKAAFRRVVKIFRNEGALNATWVYTPWLSETLNKYYPGDEYVDWIGITALNYGRASWDGKWRSFEEVYRPYRQFLLSHHKPVMLAEFGSTSYGGNNTEWLADAMATINDYKEIKSAVLFNTDKDKNWITPWRPDSTTQFIDWTIKSMPNAMGRLVKRENPDWLKLPANSTLYTSSTSRSLLVDGKPFYIKGVAYNTSQSWKDGRNPLTRRQLEKDFNAISAMGANAISRYAPTLYDKNILTIADEKKLKVIYGFHFDPKTDYLKDKDEVNKYIEEVTDKVMEYRDKPAILSWNLGNETFNLLAENFS